MEIGIVDDAACLLLSLSSGSGSDDSEGSPKRTALNKRRRRMRPTDGEFECKTCNRRFSSFQALGGHRTGHKRAKILNIKDILDRSEMYHAEHHGFQNTLTAATTVMTARKTQLHQCTICGEGFSMGQALGGHMRRHRADPVDDDVEVEVASSGLNMPLPSLEECGRSSGEVLAAVPRKNTCHNIRLLELFV